MTTVKALVFLDRTLVDQLHGVSMTEHGGCRGLRDGHAVDSAIARATLVHDYLVGCDEFDVAAAYAHGIAEAQGYLDGNKRTGIAAALVFLESNGTRTDSLDDEELFRAMIGAAKRKVSRDDIARLLRDRLSGEA